MFEELDYFEDFRRKKTQENNGLLQVTAEPKTRRPAKICCVSTNDRVDMYCTGTVAVGRGQG